MDLFGIGAAMKSITRVYFQSARETGRTTMMIDSLHEGDRVVFTNRNEAGRVQQLIRERGLKDVKCIVISKNSMGSVHENGTSRGRTIFDHMWVQEFYENSIQATEREIDWLQEQLSGYGEKHRETKRQAEEMCKWKNF